MAIICKAMIQPSKSKELQDMLFGIAEKELQEKYKLIESSIEFILRNCIDKPIKGEITKGKLRWRGIDSIAYGENFEFLGIMQRGKLVTVKNVKNDTYE